MDACSNFGVEGLYAQEDSDQESGAEMRRAYRMETHSGPCASSPDSRHVVRDSRASPSGRDSALTSDDDVRTVQRRDAQASQAARTPETGHVHRRIVQAARAAQTPDKRQVSRRDAQASQAAQTPDNRQVSRRDAQASQAARTPDTRGTLQRGAQASQAAQTPTSTVRARTPSPPRRVTRRTITRSSRPSSSERDGAPTSDDEVRTVRRRDAQAFQAAKALVHMARNGATSPPRGVTRRGTSYRQASASETEGLDDTVPMEVHVSTQVTPRSATRGVRGRTRGRGRGTPSPTRSLSLAETERWFGPWGLSGRRKSSASTPRRGARRDLRDSYAASERGRSPPRPRDYPDRGSTPRSRQGGATRVLPHPSGGNGDRVGRGRKPRPRESPSPPGRRSAPRTPRVHRRMNWDSPTRRVATPARRDPSRTPERGRARESLGLRRLTSKARAESSPPKRRTIQRGEMMRPLSDDDLPRAPGPPRQGEPLKSRRTLSTYSGKSYQLYRAAADPDELYTTIRDTACQWSESTRVEDVVRRKDPAELSQALGLERTEPLTADLAFDSPGRLTYQQQAGRELERESRLKLRATAASKGRRKERLVTPPRPSGGAPASRPSPIAEWADSQARLTLGKVGFAESKKANALFKEVRRPTYFSGNEKENWTDWVQTFDRMLHYTGCSEDYEITFRFQECLKDTALTYFNRLTRNRQTSWSVVRKAFNERFGDRSEGERGRSALQQIRLQEKDTASSFCARFEDAWEKAYPSHRIYPYVKDEILVDKFIECVNNREAQLFMARRGPRTYGELKAVFQRFMAGNAWVLGNSWIRQASKENATQVRSASDACSELDDRHTPAKAKGRPRTRAQSANAATDKRDAREAEVAAGVARELAQLRQLFSAQVAVQPTQNTARPKKRTGGSGNRGPGAVKTNPQAQSQGANTSAAQAERRKRAEERRNQHLITYLTPYAGKGNVCFYCGAPISKAHTVVTCPTRLKDEEARPGSTYASGQAPAQVRSQSGN